MTEQPIFWKAKDRYTARMLRIARWDRPLMGWWQRLHAYFNMVMVDHGIFRLVYLNKHKVTGEFWRSAQPSPGQLHNLARQGLKTVVNLRGGREYGSWPLEKHACDAASLDLVDIVMRSRAAPDKETLLGLPDFFKTLTYPVLVHCKSGADRAGLMAALYLIIIERKTVAEASRQLSWRYGHFRFAKTGILDAFLEDYAREGEARGIPFLTWVEHHYDPEALNRDFKPGLVSELIVDRLLHRE